MRRLRVLAMGVVMKACQIARLLPIKKDRIVFVSHQKGGQYSDSPMLICEYLQKRYPGKYEICWTFRDPSRFQHLAERGIILVKFATLKDFWYSNTAKVYVTNLFGPFPYVIKRPGRMIIETSHGVAYKSLLTSASDKGDVGRLERWFRRAKINNCDVCLSGNAILTDKVYRGELGFRDEIMESGLPRNDAFFSDTHRIRESVLFRLGLSSDCKIALLMPTWRRDNATDNIDFDYRRIAGALSSKHGGKWVILIRLHHLSSVDISDRLETYPDCLVDAADGFDPQELLCSADLLITDYSSVIWDFALLRRPILLFQPDIDSYEEERGFNVPPSDWGLFSAKNEDGLVSLIDRHSLDELSSMSDRHLARFGSCETGRATELVCNLIHDYSSNESSAPTVEQNDEIPESGNAIPLDRKMPAAPISELPKSRSSFWVHGTDFEQ